MIFWSTYQSCFNSAIGVMALEYLKLCFLISLIKTDISHYFLHVFQSLFMEMLHRDIPEVFINYPEFYDIPHNEETWTWDPDTLLLKVNTSCFVHWYNFAKPCIIYFIISMAFLVCFINIRHYDEIVSDEPPRQIL